MTILTQELDTLVIINDKKVAVYTKLILGPSSTMTFVNVLINTMVPDLFNDELENNAERPGNSTSALPQNNNLVYDFPSRVLTTNLLDIYFDHLHFHHPYLDEKAIRSSTDLIYDKNSAKKIRRATLTLLNMVFALASQWFQWSRKEKSIPFELPDSNTFFERAKVLMSQEALGTQSIESSKYQISTVILQLIRPSARLAPHVRVSERDP